MWVVHSCVAALSGLLPEDLSPLSHHLLTIPTVTVGVVCLEFKGRVLPPQYEEVRLFSLCATVRQKQKVFT